jgi:hypothetical protein
MWRGKYVDMVSHQNIGVDGNIVPLGSLPQPTYIRHIVAIFEEYWLTATATLNYMHRYVWKKKSGLSWHIPVQ